MDSSTSLQNAHKRSSAGETGNVHGRKSRIWRGVAIALWIMGLVTLITASVLTRNHPGPWPIVLAMGHLSTRFCRDVQ